jgi:hypothetical protein
MTEFRCLVCQHVFDDTSPVLLVAREDGEWICVCGGLHSDVERFYAVGINHLVDRDPTLRSLPHLDEGYEAERDTLGGEWRVSPLSSE